MMFLDGICPVCGRTCGNNGAGTALHCDCGWVGEIDSRDLEAINEFLKAARQRDEGGTHE